MTTNPHIQPKTLTYEMLQDVFDKMQQNPHVYTSALLLPNQLIKICNRYIVPVGFDGKRDDYKIYDVPDDVSFEPKITFVDIVEDINEKNITVRCDWRIEWPLAK